MVLTSGLTMNALARLAVEPFFFLISLSHFVVASLFLKRFKLVDVLTLLCKQEDQMLNLLII